MIFSCCLLIQPVTSFMCGELTDTLDRNLSTALVNNNNGQEGTFSFFLFPLLCSSAVSLWPVTHSVALLLLTFPLLFYLLPITPLRRFPGRQTPNDSLSAFSISGTSSADLLRSICCIGPQPTPPSHPPLPHHPCQCLAFKGETRVKTHLAGFCC